MYENDFSREIVGDVVVEKVNIGRVTVKEAQIFKERLMTPSLAGFKKIIVDLSDCQFIDSSIIGVLVVALKHFRKKGCELKVVIPPVTAFQVFTISGLYQIFNLYNSVDDALASIDASITI